MELLIWSLIFALSIFALVRASDWFSQALQKLSRRIGISNTQSQLIALSLGAALPELAASIAAILQGKSELVVPLIIGSSIANILLVVGLGVLAAKSLSIKKEHIDLDAPLLAGSLAIFYFAAQDGQINSLEGLLMVLAIFVYLVYVYSARRRHILTTGELITPELLKDGRDNKIIEILPTRLEKNLGKIDSEDSFSFEKTIIMLVGGVLLLAVSANFAISSLVSISGKTLLPAATIASLSMALGVALPEIWQGFATARRKRYEMVMGNVFGATTINLLLVCGVSASLYPLKIDSASLAISLPFLIAAAALLSISSFSRRINLGEGMMYLFIYFLFVIKLLGLF